MKGRTALVTGAGRGLGRELALAFAVRGCNLVVNYHASREGAEQLVRCVDAMGVKAIAVGADVTRQADAERLVLEACDTFGRLDILVNNAGINRDGLVWNLEPAAWDEVLQVNLTGMFHCVRAAVPPMRERSWGRVVNISSVIGQSGMPGTAAYAASKAGVLGFTKTVAREVAASGITVNALCLGYFDEGLARALPANVRERVTKQIPVGRFGRVDELAATVAFLASEEASYVTGQEININGGLLM